MLTKKTVKAFKHSAYKSMQLSHLGLTKSVSKANKGALKRWSDEKWLNLNALRDKSIEIPCGQNNKGKKEQQV